MSDTPKQQLHEGKTTNDQKQEPKPKRASRARKAKAPVEAGGAINDPALYAEMARPYATREEANAALSTFLAAVRMLRIRLRIADVVTVACVHIEGSGPIITWGQNGDASRASLMLSWALGSSEAGDKDRLEAMRQRGGKEA